ncbi:MAG: 3'-5' exonuclease [Spirochaetaceae bacterium]|jgi:DNA polymerase-3 subunit epsilon|nr:3'-5' exonuclease [Spirochaetaceae bacterium]
MQDFAAIDFETANKSPSSVCSVGIVVVRGGLICNSYYHLIHPTPNYFLRWFTEEIHGISREDTEDQPRFPEVWAEAVPVFGELPLVAHNAQFDEGCLKAVHAAYDMPYPGYHFYCTCIAARRHYRGSLPNHQLQTVAAACGYDLKNHHQALADAEACAAIALKLL